MILLSSSIIYKETNNTNTKYNQSHHQMILKSISILLEKLLYYVEFPCQHLHLSY